MPQLGEQPVAGATHYEHSDRRAAGSGRDRTVQVAAGWNVIVSNPKEYAQHLAEADALLVRSAVQVTQEVLEKAPKLRVIGRAGVGVDNVDLDAATAAGVLVMNTPGGNAISVAEHTLALMLAMARHIPQANASTRAGKWEKKKFMGNELRGKTLGIVGLGSIGREVVKRARAFEMRILAHDPYVTSQIAAGSGRGAGAALPSSTRRATTSRCTSSLTPETDRACSRREAFAQMKTGVRIVNCARGELVDEARAQGGDRIRQSGRRRAGRVRKRAAARRLSAVRARRRAGHAAHRRLHRRGAGDRRRAHRRAGGGVSAARRRHQRGQHARAVARAVSGAGPVRDAGRAAGQLRRAYRHGQSAQPCG